MNQHVLIIFLFVKQYVRGISMVSQNLLLSHFRKRETALKWLFLSFGYFILFAFLENPVIKTISLIGKEHSVLFAIFCFIYAVSMTTNLSYLNRNFHIRNRFFYILSFAFSSLFGFVATTLMPDKDIGDVTLFATIAHWVFGFGGILVNTVCVLVFLLDFCKKSAGKKLKSIFWLCTGAGILDLLVFVVLTVFAGGNVQKSKNGFLEIVPMTVTFFVLYIINHTDLVSEREERDIKEKNFTVSDSSVFAALSFGSLGFSWIVFTLFAFVRNPVHFTISMTGTQYPVGFAVTSFSLALAFVLNFIQMFRKNGYRNILAWILATVGPVSIILCVVSPTKMGNELDPVHSVAALVFFFFILAAFLLYYFHNRKDKKRLPFLFGTLAVLAAVSLAMLFLFVIFEQKYGRTGLTELIPLEYFSLCFYLENHSDYFENEKIRISK